MVRPQGQSLPSSLLPSPSLPPFPPFLPSHSLPSPSPRSIHDVKATDMGADTVRFKAEVNFDGREVARMHVDMLDLEKLMKVPQHMY